MEAGFVQAVGSIIPISLGGLLATANQESNQRNSFHQFFFWQDRAIRSQTSATVFDIFLQDGVYEPDSEHSLLFIEIQGRMHGCSTGC